VSAVVEATVPKLWENTAEAVPSMDIDGQVGGPFFGVYASWNGKGSDIRPPGVYVTSVAAPFYLGLYLHPDNARELAAGLLKAADLADATRAALNADQPTFEEGE